MRRAFISLVIVVAAATANKAQTRADAGALLTRYLHGERALELPAPFNVKDFISSVTNVLGNGLPGPPEAARRATAAFMLEAAEARLDAGDLSSSNTLLEWACVRVRAHEPADDFDAAWHTAALSIAEAWLGPLALESHVRHARDRLPDDPFLALSWALAAEQRASPALLAQSMPAFVNPTAIDENRARQAAIAARLMDEAADRLTKAAAHPRTAADAHLRLARLALTRGNPTSALDQLASVERDSREGWVIYLARVFRGQALDQLNRPDEAAAAFRDALKIGPGGQTATMWLSTLLYRRGERDQAESLVQRLLAETDPISDPWWTYWSGSARLWTTRLAAMRGLLQ